MITPVVFNVKIQEPVNMSKMVAQQDLQIHDNYIDTLEETKELELDVLNDFVIEQQNFKTIELSNPIKDFFGLSRDKNMSKEAKNIIDSFVLACGEDTLGVLEDGLMPKDIKSIEEIYAQKDKGDKLTISKSEDGTTTVCFDVDGDGHIDRSAVYDANGKIISENFRGSGERLDIEYDDNGNVNGIVWTNSRLEYAEYYSNKTGQRDIYEQDAKGDTIHSTYDKDGNMIFFEIRDSENRPKS